MAPALKQKNANATDPADAAGQRKHRQFKAGENSLKHWENMKNEVLKELREHKRTDIPQGQFFKDIKRSDIISAASVYFGGINGVRASLMAEGLLPLKDLPKPQPG